MKHETLPHQSHLCLGALFLALGLTLPAAGQVTFYGSGVNPPGSLVLTSGVPQVGQSFNVGVLNTATSSAPAALAFLGIASAPDPAFPAGSVLPGFGLFAPGAAGELLISLIAPDPFLTFGPVNWAGGIAPPAEFTVVVPLKPALTGVTFYLQGMLADLSSGPSLGLTNGLAVQLTGPATPTPEPCLSELPGMSIIQKGTFEMGSEAASGPPYFGTNVEKPVHTVRITYCYWIGRFEVTQAEYQALLGVNPAWFPAANNPVERVSWFDAQAYCAALTAQQSALGRVPAGYQYRLPTEAEWEYACRAGTTTEFNGGSDLFCDEGKILYSYHTGYYCNSRNTVPVGSYLPNAWGLFDMHGNVSEWCLDSYASYSGEALTDPFVTGGPCRILRGGSWINHSFISRSAYRTYKTPTSEFSYTYIGFRVALAPMLAP